MKVTERLAIVDRLGSELSERYDFARASAFLRAFIPKFRANSEDFYDVKELVFYALTDAQDSVLGEMIDDLGLESFGTISASIQPPKIWQDQKRFRAFVSHLSLEKDKAKRLRDVLAGYGISAFVAHEDIEPTLEWQVQIERALQSMELFISIHTAGYAKSVWCQQEIGFAVAKGTKIIALRMGEDPTGFISKHQALSRGSKTAEQIAKEMEPLLLADDRTKVRYALSKTEQKSDDEPPF